MKRTILYVLAAVAIAFSSCKKSEPEAAPNVPLKLIIDITKSDDGLNTKGQKTSWEAGDQAMIFFNEGFVNDTQIKIEFDGANWNIVEVGSQAAAKLYDGYAKDSKHKFYILHYPGEMSFDTSRSPKFGFPDGLILYQNDLYYSYDSGTGELNLGTVTLSRLFPQIRLTVPGNLNPNDFTLTSSSNFNHTYMYSTQFDVWEINNNSSACILCRPTPKASFITGFEPDDYDTGPFFPMPGKLDGSDLVFYPAIYTGVNKKSTLTEYRFLIQKKSENPAAHDRKSAHLYMYTITKDATHTLKEGMNIKLPPLYVTPDGDIASGSGNWVKISGLN